MPSYDIDVNFNVENGDLSLAQKELNDLEKKADELRSKKLQLKLDTDTSKLDETNKKIEELKNTINVIKGSANIPINIRDEALKAAEKELSDLEKKRLDLELAVADDEIKVAKKEVDDLKGEKVGVDVDVDDSQIKNAKKELEDLQKQLSNNVDGTANAVNGVISGLAGKSIWDTVYGTSKKAETNKILIKNMGDLKTSSETLYNTIDKTTDSSLISMQQLIPALNGIKSATGATAGEINSASTKVASFGQYVYAMTGSEAKAEQAMFDLSKGIKGAYASLDQYGITEDALMRTGLWSGKEDDLNGYLDAVNKVTGSTDDLMNSTQGLEALMGKSFSRAGKKLGETVLPAVKNLLQGFNDLDSATGGWLSTGILIGGSIASSVTTGLSAVNQAKQGFDALKGGVETVKDSIDTVSGTFDKAKGAIDAFRQGQALANLVEGEGAIAHGLNALGITSEAAAADGAAFSFQGLAIAEGAALWPILAIIGAVILLVAAVYEIGKAFGWWSDVGTMLEAIQAGLNRLWQAFINNPDVQAFMQGLKDAWNWLLQAIQPVIGAVLNFFGISTGGNFDIVRALINAVSTAWGRVKAQINLVISVVRLFASGVQAAVNTAKGVLGQISSKWTSVKNAISNAATGIKNAITAPFQAAWATVKPIYDKFQAAVNWGKQLIGWSGAEFEGFSTSDVGYEGFDGTLNDAYYNQTSNSNSNVVNNNFNINGIIEQEASEYIVDSMNNYLKRQNLIRGV